MVAQVADDSATPIRLKGSTKKPITAKEYKQVQSLYTTLYGDDQTVGLRSGIREAFQFDPAKEEKNIRQLAKRNGVKLSAKKIAKLAQELATEKTEKLKQELGQGGSGMRYAYISTMAKPDGTFFKAKVVHKDNEADYIIINNVIRRSEPLDPEAMATNAKRELNRAIDELGRETNKIYQIGVSNGRYLDQAESPELIVGSVQKLMMQYRNTEKNNYWGNWLSDIGTLAPAGQKNTAHVNRMLREHIEAKQIVRKRARKARIDTMKKFGLYKPRKRLWRSGERNASYNDSP